MESNGLARCIHVSQETADILTSLGKGHWVHPREDKIHAKGKGELQTYWIKPNGFGQTMNDTSKAECSSWDDSEGIGADMEGTHVEDLVANVRKGLIVSDAPNDHTRRPFRAHSRRHSASNYPRKRDTLLLK
jgi:Adenylate and Guanylate cyclase catalytic domain